MPVFSPPVQLPPVSSYLFIDGNYLRQAYKKVIEGFFGAPGDLDVTALKASTHATKAFYYDALDADAADYQDRVALHQKIQRFDSFHVRHGSVVGKRKRRSRLTFN